MFAFLQKAHNGERANTVTAYGHHPARAAVILKRRHKVELLMLHLDHVLYTYRKSTAGERRFSALDNQILSAIKLAFQIGKTHCIICEISYCMFSINLFRNIFIHS